MGRSVAADAAAGLKRPAPEIRSSRSLERVNQGAHARGAPQLHAMKGVGVARAVPPPRKKAPQATRANVVVDQPLGQHRDTEPGAREVPQVLTDKGNRVAREFKLAFASSDALGKLQTHFGSVLPKFNGDDSWELPMPGTFVLDRRGVVKFASVDPNWMVRVEPAAILEALRGARAS